MEVQYSPKAKEDLQKIKLSIVEKFSSEDIAIRVLKRITKEVRNLEVFPYMGVAVSERTGTRTDYRYIFCEKNYIFYRIVADTVRIIRILNEKEDYVRILFGISGIEK